MARRSRPGRTLVAFFIGVAIAFGLVALTGTWKPELGLDLQGGTRIQLSAKGDPSAAALEEARKIIDQRVNGSGVSEAEVTTQGSQYVVVEIPGQNRPELVETVKRQAQLRFRLVACSDAKPCGGSAGAAPPGMPGAGSAPVPSGPATGTPSTKPDRPSAKPTATGPSTTKPGATKPGTAKPSTAKGSGANRPPVGFDRRARGAGPTSSPSSSAAVPTTPAATATATPTGSPTGSPTAAPTGSPSATTPVPPPEGGPLADDPLKWYQQPSPDAVRAFNAFSCPQQGPLPQVVDDPAKPLVTCGRDEQSDGSSITTKYLLSPAMIEGTDLSKAAAQPPQQQQAKWVVTLSFNGTGTDEFAKISKALYCPSGGPQCDQFAVVLDGAVISAPTMNGLITNGQAQIEGNFNEQTAKSLATSLKFGALPIAFDDDQTVVETVGPSLAGNQLSAGITAGLFGLGLVMLYCLFYYRGLGLVVIASLLIAAAVTYAMVLLLSQAAGYTLTLPGIAGLIVAVGITADSFVVFFERIRDEMREGKSMRVAVESGWVRARNTCLAADAVSLLAAVVLYIFAAGVVKGFAFALGLSTLIDLVVFFWFTKPMVSFLARYPVFNRGHKLSGLDAESLGIDRVTPSRARASGGRA